VGLACGVSVRAGGVGSEVQPARTIVARQQSAGRHLIRTNGTDRPYPIVVQRTERATTIASSSVPIPSNR
jgi:hypothetical protein